MGLNTTMRSLVMSGLALAVANQVRASRIDNPEAAAIAALKAINVGQAMYSSSCADGGYAVDLADLRKPPFGKHFTFIGPELYANGVMIDGGYVLTIEKDAAPDTAALGSAEETCNGSEDPPVTAFYASATPTAPGLRYFATDTRGTIFVSTRRIRNPIPAGTPVIR